MRRLVFDEILINLETQKKQQELVFKDGKMFLGKSLFELTQEKMLTMDNPYEQEKSSQEFGAMEEK